MKTKNDYWRNVLYAYCFIIIGLILLIFRINTLPEIPQLFGVLIFTGIGMYFVIKAVKIYQELEDKKIYPSQLDFLNKLAFKLYSNKKKSRKTFIVATIVGLTLGVFLGYYMT